MSKGLKDLLKLDVRILGSIYINGDFAIYECELLNGNEIHEKKEDEFYIDKTEEIIITGNFDKRFYYGEEYYVYAQQTEHPRFGLQYKVQLVQTKFDTPERIKAFLLQYCADSIATQLVDQHGADVINKILDNNLDYSTIKGMGDFRFKQLQEKVRENEYMKDIIATFTDYGITPNQMRNIVKTFGANAISKVQENPYVLCQVYGIGFLKADEVARRMEYPMDSLNRIDEAVKYVIERMQNDGNVWIERKYILAECEELLEVGMKRINDRLEEGISGVLIVENHKVTLQKTYDAEATIARKITEMLSDSNELRFDVEKFLEEIESEGINLTEEQKGFFYSFKKHNVNLLIGYAGCGKSFLQKLLFRMTDALGLQVLCLAPTGKAAKVMEKYTGRDAYTIHRRLGIGEDNSEGKMKEIWEEVILIDESSMSGVMTLSKVFRAIKNPSTRIIFIGDDFQLPSVEVGNFLHDAIESGVIPTTKLTKVFRQADGGILDIVTKIRQKERFIDNKFVGKQKFGNDMLFHSMGSAQIQDAYKEYYRICLKRFKPDEIVILTPTKKNTLGTNRINPIIQEIANPPSKLKKEVKHGQETIFREGDRIMNIKNNYKAINMEDQDIFVANGDIGYIIGINTEKMHVVIDFGFDVVKIPFSTLDTIVHAYAMTIHKSQGSGFPCVIVITDSAQQFQLNANLIYTGYTRTEQVLFALCQSETVNRAIGKNVSLQRNTFLEDLLKF